MLSDCVNKAILDHPNLLITPDIPWTISKSLDTVLKKLGNTEVLERREDEADGEI